MFAICPHEIFRVLICKLQIKHYIHWLGWWRFNILFLSMKLYNSIHIPQHSEFWFTCFDYITTLSKWKIVEISQNTNVPFYPVFHNFEIRKILKKLRINHQINNGSTVTKRLFSTLDQTLGDTKSFWYQVLGSTFHFD